MFKFSSSSDKSLVHRTHKELSVEFNISMHMLVLLNWLLLLYVQLNHGKIAVIRISFVVVLVKILAPEKLEINLYKLWLIST
jgi:hypothetical protein